MSTHFYMIFFFFFRRNLHLKTKRRSRHFLVHHDDIHLIESRKAIQWKKKSFAKIGYSVSRMRVCCEHTINFIHRVSCDFKFLLSLFMVEYRDYCILLLLFIFYLDLFCAFAACLKSTKFFACGKMCQMNFYRWLMNSVRR